MIKVKLQVFSQYILWSVLLLWIGALKAQCPDVAGLVCDPSAEFGAPVLCDLDCLNGFSSRLPDTSFSIQPNRLCSDGGDPNNMSWFAFVAGADSINITVIPTNCTTVRDSMDRAIYSSIQAGIMGTCDFNNPEYIACYNNCEVDRTTPNPAVVATNLLVPGRMYFFYVDGCGGTVCDYEVRVNFGTQPFAVKDPTGISSSATGDTLCTGQRNVAFGMLGVDENINYHWRMFPPYPGFPDTDGDGAGEFPDFTSDTIMVNFPVSGDYTLFGYADNACDQSDTVFYNIHVRDIEPLLFDTVALCGDQFPYLGPAQLVNGDLVIWMSGQIFSPGDHQGTVSRSDGCVYEEFVHVDLYDSSVGRDTLFVCAGGFPIDYHGIMINGFADAGRKTIGLDRFGCDSIVDLSILGVDVQGDLLLLSCENSLYTYDYSVSSVEPSDYDRLEFRFFDGATQINTDPSLSTLTTSINSGNLRLEITIFNNGSSCAVQKPLSISDDQKPSAPIFISPVDTICGDVISTEYNLATDGTETSVHWIIDGVELSDQGQNITLNWSDHPNVQELCTYARNTCGVSDTVCVSLSFVTLPEVSFSMAEDTVCVGEELTLSYNGDPGVDITWNAGAATVVSAGQDDLTIRLDQPQTYTIELTGTKDGCNAIPDRSEVVALPSSTLEGLTCTPYMESITFSWDPLPGVCNAIYTLSSGSQVLYTGSDNLFELRGLPMGHTQEVQLSVVADCGCFEGVVVSTSCTTNNCTSIDLQLSGIFGLVCMEEIGESIQYDASVIGSDGSGIGSWSGGGIGSDGLFIIDENEMGPHNFIYTFEENGCAYVDSISLNILDNPDLVLDLTSPDCPDDEEGELNIQANGGSGSYTFFINGSMTNNLDQVSLREGDYTIQVIDDASCADQEVISITIPESPDLSIQGSGDIIKGSSDVLSIDMSGFIGTIIDSILWSSSDGLALCPSGDCSSILVSPDSPTSYIVRVHYNDGCLIETTYLLSVRPQAQFEIANIFNPLSANLENQSITIKSNFPNLQINHWYIYDRWGNLVHAQENFQVSDAEPWDGRLNGQLLNSGVYVYQILATDRGTAIEKNGTITLLR